MSKHFEIGDIVEQNGHNESLLTVTGVIHDSERLFVCDHSKKLSQGREFELHFVEVTRCWRELKSNDVSIINTTKGE